MSKVEDKMKNQDINYEEILNDLNIGYYKGELQGKLQGKIIKHNKAFNKILGYEFSESLIGSKGSDFFLDKEERAKYYNELLKKGFVQNIPIRIKNKKNKVLVLQFNSHIIRDNLGFLLFFEGTFVDITEKFEIEQKLKESEERFKSITDQSIVSIVIIQDDEIKYINNQLINLAGYSIEEIRNWKPRDFLKVFHPEDRAFALEQAIKKQTGKKDVINHYEIRFIKGNGETMWIDNYSKTINYDGRPADMAVLIDITKRKETELKLKVSEKKYKLITENANDMIAVLNNKFEYEYFNEDSSVKSMGYRKEDVIGKSVFEFIHPDDISEVTNALNLGLKKGEATHVFRFRHKNGSWIWLESKGKVFLNEMDQIRGIIVSRDITERKNFEEKIKESERKYKDLSQELETILDIIPVMIFCKDKNGKVTRVNKIFADILKLKKEELLGKTNFDFFPKEQADAFQKDDLEVINTGKPKLNIEEIVDFPERKIYSITQKVPLTNDQGDIVGVIGLAIDNTDRKRAEESLKESEKKYREAYDKANFYKELIAHDMNNILHTIQSSVELFELFQKSPENIKYRKNVFDIISSQIFRGANLVSNIIKLSEIEETKIPTKIIEAKRILDNSIEHINRSYQDLKIKIKVETDLIKIYLKANELLSDLFENLLVNAVKHNENPEIEIQIKISEEILNEINYIKFEFVDNGIGIPDEIKQDLFEKNIDRKRHKKGLGIGLSLVRQIVNSYNGKITIKNRIEGDYKKGSNFVVLIPAAE